LPASGVRLQNHLTQFSLVKRYPRSGRHQTASLTRGVTVAQTAQSKRSDSAVFSPVSS